jgi:hypothetical protein
MKKMPKWDDEYGPSCGWICVVALVAALILLLVAAAARAEDGADASDASSAIEAAGGYAAASSPIKANAALDDALLEYAMTERRSEILTRISHDSEAMAALGMAPGMPAQAQGPTVVRIEPEAPRVRPDAIRLGTIVLLIAVLLLAITAVIVLAWRVPPAESGRLIVVVLVLALAAIGVAADSEQYSSLLSLLGAIVGYLLGQRGGSDDKRSDDRGNGDRNHRDGRRRRDSRASGDVAVLDEGWSGLDPE